MAKFTEKQKAFVEEYLIDLNATAAYKRAGYKAKGNAAEVNANRLLRNAKVQKEIQRAMDERSKRTKITADSVLEEYAKIAFSNINHYLEVVSEERIVDLVENEEGDKEPVKAVVQTVNMFDTNTIGGDKMSAVAEIKQMKEGIALKLHDKKGALDSIARHLGMFTDKVELSGGIKVDNPFEGLTVEELRILAKSEKHD